MSSVAVEGVARRYGTVSALAPIDLAVEDGEFVVIIGASGCGKSTLLRLIAGLESPSEGRVLIGGRDVTQLEPADRDVAMVFQSYALYPHLSVAQNIGFPLRMRRVGRDEIASRTAAVAAMLDLSDLLDRRPRALSGGQRQRVSIGRAIIRNPGVLLLDEPLSNLDTELRVRMRHTLARLHQQIGSTMIYVTHDQVEAMTLANRIVVMAAGRVAQVGAPLDLYRDPATIEVARTIGSPAMNLIAVTIATADPDSAVVTLPDSTSVRVAARVPAAAVGTAATLGVRPEHLTSADHGDFGGRVELFERLGPLSFVHLGTPGFDGVIVAQLPSDRSVMLGETLRFKAGAHQLTLFADDGAALPRTRPG